MKQINTNIAPTGYPAPRDMRHTPDAVAASAYQAVHSTNAQPKADPIRAVVVANLALAGIVTNGKTDDQLLADYGQLIRRTQIEQIYRTEQRARQLEDDAWNNYSINDAVRGNHV